jgi:hypothetical protein
MWLLELATSSSQINRAALIQIKWLRTPADPAPVELFLIGSFYVRRPLPLLYHSDPPLSTREFLSTRKSGVIRNYKVLLVANGDRHYFAGCPDANTALDGHRGPVALPN